MNFVTKMRNLFLIITQKCSLSKKSYTIFAKRLNPESFECIPLARTEEKTFINSRLKAQQATLLLEPPVVLAVSEWRRLRNQRLSGQTISSI